GRLPREGSNARLVSFSVDPENDTPAVLAAYAAHADADPAHWSFVTGPVDSVKATVVTGFKVALEKLPTTNDGTRDYDVTHGDWFVLVDPRGDTRGYYTTDAPKGVDRLVRDALPLGHGGSRKHVDRVERVEAERSVARRYVTAPKDPHAKVAFSPRPGGGSVDMTWRW